MAQAKEDDQLARLYDYTKFHLGIYLSFAGGIAALLGTQEAGWFLSCLVDENKETLYVALGFMVLAGMCGGVVATSTIECQSFQHFWEEPQRPQSLPLLVMPGRRWAMLEHLFFWLSLLTLGYAVAVGFPKLSSSHASGANSQPQAACCCVQAASAPKCSLHGTRGQRNKQRNKGHKGTRGQVLFFAFTPRQKERPDPVPACKISTGSRNRRNRGQVLSFAVTPRQKTRSGPVPCALRN